MLNNSIISNAKRLMSGNIMVFSITGLLGNFARAMVFPYGMSLPSVGMPKL